MKVLIVGGNSSLGRALKPMLSTFAEVVTAGRSGCDIQLDVTDPLEKITIPAGIDTIIHTAAGFGGRSAAEILETENINSLGTLKLCAVAQQAKVKHFIFISSIYALLDEEAPQFSIYALSKKHAEELARFYCAVHSLPLTILRPSQLYGNESSFQRHQPFFYSIVEKAEKGEDVSLYGSHDPSRNYIHIDDLTAVIAKLVQGRIEGSYSCMYPSDVTYSQIANAAFAATGHKGAVHFLPDKPDIPDNIFEKDLSLYKMIGFYPRVSIEEGIKDLINYRKGQ